MVLLTHFDLFFFPLPLAQEMLLPGRDQLGTVDGGANSRKDLAGTMGGEGANSRQKDSSVLFLRQKMSSLSLMF